MACDCLSNIEKLLKEKTNETATVHKELISGRVIVQGIYHKPKRNGDGYQSKWEELNLLAKYCPFCGKPYDIKQIYGSKAVEIKENLICTQVSVHDWKYDEEDEMYPVLYELDFRYYDTEISAYLSTVRLQKQELVFDMIEGEGDLLNAFEDILHFNVELGNKIYELCKKCWDEEFGKDSKYEFYGPI